MAGQCNDFRYNTLWDGYLKIPQRLSVEWRCCSCAQRCCSCAQMLQLRPMTSHSFSLTSCSISNTRNPFQTSIFWRACQWDLCKERSPFLNLMRCQLTSSFSRVDLPRESTQDITNSWCSLASRSITCTDPTRGLHLHLFASRLLDESPIYYKS